MTDQNEMDEILDAALDELDDDSDNEDDNRCDNSAETTPSDTMRSTSDKALGAAEYVGRLFAFDPWDGHRSGQELEEYGS